MKGNQDNKKVGFLFLGAAIIYRMIRNPEDIGIILSIVAVSVIIGLIIRARYGAKNK